MVLWWVSWGGLVELIIFVYKFDGGGSVCGGLVWKMEERVGIRWRYSYTICSVEGEKFYHVVHICDTYIIKKKVVNLSIFEDYPKSVD
jgi:hypothetical protein